MSVRGNLIFLLEKGHLRGGRKGYLGGEETSEDRREPGWGAFYEGKFGTLTTHNPGLVIGERSFLLASFKGAGIKKVKKGETSFWRGIQRE